VKPIVLAVLLVVAPPARALDRWTWQDTAWESAAAGALALDWGTTLDGAYRRNHWHSSHGRLGWHEETNPILGRRPKAAEINAYFVSAIALHVGVAAVLPSGWRRAWQVGTVGVEAYVVRGNVRAGLTVRF
jgi:hypothetical protein